MRRRKEDLMKSTWQYSLVQISWWELRTNSTTEILEIRSEIEEEGEKKLENLVFGVRDFVRKRERLISPSNLQWGIKIGANDVVAADQGRSLADFQSSKWREKRCSWVSCYQ
ncbi:hypothetical protein ACHQM5_012266 [Ranunculus cassubicifolius]